MSARTPAASSSPSAPTEHPSDPPIGPDERHRAFALDRTLQRNFLLGVAVFTLLVVLLAAGQVMRLGIIPILFAVTAPRVLSRGDRLQDATLRAQTGVSRAAHVRARTRLTLLLQLGLIVVAAVVILIGPQTEDLETMRQLVHVGGVSIWLPTASFAVDLALWVPAVLWSHVWCGRDALRRIGGGWASALGAYLGTYLLMLVVASVVGVSVAMVLGGSSIEFSDTAEWVSLVVAGAMASVLALVTLRWRLQVWARTA